MNQQEFVFDLLQSTETNWTVRKEQLFTSNGLPSIGYGIYRSDNDKCLGLVKGRYAPFQNYEMAELVCGAVSMLNLNIVQRGGQLHSGKKVYYQVQLPDEVIGKSGVKRYVTALNSHDGTSSIAFGSSNTVVVCQNTFYKAYKETDKVVHCSTAKARLEQMSIQLQQAIDYDNNLMGAFHRMTKVSLHDAMIERVINKMFRVEAKKTKQEELSTRTKNNIVIFADNLKTEVGIHGNNVWSLFNAVTRYTTHHASPTDEQKKMDYLMAGRGRVLSNLAFNELIEFIDARIDDSEIVLV